MHAPPALDRSNPPAGDEYGRLGSVARLLYALLDAADDDGLMGDWEHQEKWRGVRNQAERSGYIPVLPFLIELMTGLEEAGRLDHSWILRRWNAVKTKLPVSRC